MIEHKILLVDDEELIREAIASILSLKDIEVLTAESGHEALEIFNKNPVPLVITDLKMPKMNGFELVEKFLQLEDPPIIIVQSAIDDIEPVIELMRSGVYDYIIKPFKNDEIIKRVENGFNAAELKRIQFLAQKERDLRIQSQLEWNHLREQTQKQYEDNSDTIIIESLRTSISQGIGFGSLVSTIQMIKRRAIRSDDGSSYTIPARLMDILLSNYEASEKIIHFFESLNNVIQNPLACADYSIADFFLLIQSCIDELNFLFENKEIKMNLCQDKYDSSNKHLYIQVSIVKKVIQELLFNILKFSRKKSSSYIIMEVHAEFLRISFLNSPEVSQEGDIYGIPPEYSNLVFEPFFRISKLVYEDVPSLDFGLGLTYVDKVIRKHNGKVLIYNVRSHIERENRLQLVNVEIELPLVRPNP
jgi:CheY-like chemotaxis protein